MKLVDLTKKCQSEEKTFVNVNSELQFTFVIFHDFSHKSHIKNANSKLQRVHFPHHVFSFFIICSRKFSIPHSESQCVVVYDWLAEQ